MTDDELDIVYTALSEAIADVGKDRAPLMLATLSLALMVDHDTPDEALKFIAQAQRLTAVQPSAATA